MGQAYAYKKGELKSDEVSAEIKELADNMTLKQLKDFASTKHTGLPETVDEAFIGPFVFNDSMSDEELLGMYNGALDGYANYAKGMHYTKSDYKKAYQEIEKILKKRGITVDENITPANLTGMGPVVLPGNGTVGSGDVPAGSGDAEEEYKKKRKKMKYIKTFEAYSQDDINMSYGFYGQIETSFNEKKAKTLFDQGVKDLQKKYKLTETGALGVLNSKMGRKAADEIYNNSAKTAVEGLESYYGKSLQKYIAEVQRSLVHESNEIIEEATDINDPVLVAMRAMKSTMAAKKAQAALDKKKRVYGKQRDVLEDQLWDIANELKDLTSERSQLYTDMESEAGERGTEWSDEDANRYGGELNAIEDRIDALKTKRKQIEDRLSY